MNAATFRSQAIDRTESNAPMTNVDKVERAIVVVLVFWTSDLPRLGLEVLAAVGKDGLSNEVQHTRKMERSKFIVLV